MVWLEAKYLASSHYVTANALSVKDGTMAGYSERVEEVKGCLFLGSLLGGGLLLCGSLFLGSCLLFGSGLLLGGSLLLRGGLLLGRLHREKHGRVVSKRITN